jgi:hypothetical protein
MTQALYAHMNNKRKMKKKTNTVHMNVKGKKIPVETILGMWE